MIASANSSGIILVSRLYPALINHQFTALFSVENKLLGKLSTVSALDMNIEKIETEHGKSERGETAEEEKKQKKPNGE